MVTVTVTAKFHNPSLSRRKEWQRATRIYRDTKKFCIDGWENGDFSKSVTTSSIDNELYSAIQNQAIREAKSDHSKDGEVRYRESQPFAVNNQNWEIDTTDNGTVVVGFPCVSQWWYTPIEVYDDISDPVDRLVEGDADKTRYRSTVVATTGTVRSTPSTTLTQWVRRPSESISVNATSSLRRPTMKASR